MSNIHFFIFYFFNTHTSVYFWKIVRIAINFRNVLEMNYITIKSAKKKSQENHIKNIFGSLSPYQIHSKQERDNITMRQVWIMKFVPTH